MSNKPVLHVGPDLTPKPTGLEWLAVAVIRHPFLCLGLLLMVMGSMCGHSGRVGDPNEGYMTYSDDRTLTAVALKEGMGKELTPSERQFLDLAKSGRLGKPYYDRPDKSR
jgi:hypothetical protein